MENLAKAVIAVMKAVKGMEKNSRVGTGNASYDGTRDMDVKEVFNEALAANGLCLLPIDIQDETEISRWEETYNGNTKQKQSVFTKVKTKYLLLHVSGESQTLSGYGHGVDTQDKGAGKATTYALKNCLLLSFLTPVGKMPDTDLEHSDDIPVPPKSNDEAKENKIANILFLIKSGTSNKEEAIAKFRELTGCKTQKELGLQTYEKLTLIENKVSKELGF